MFFAVCLFFQYGAGGSVRPDFPLKNTHKKHGLKTLDLAYRSFFSIFGWGDPSQLGSWSKGCVKPLKLSREAI